MKRPLLTLFFVSIVPSIIFLIGGLWYFSRLLTPMLSIEWTETSSFGNIDTEEFQSLDFFPVDETPYIYCEFSNSNGGRFSPNERQIKTFVINVETGKCVLQAQWINYEQSRPHRESIIQSNGVFVEDDQPVLLLTYHKRVNIGSQGNNQDSFLNRMKRFLFSQRKTIHRLYFKDKIKKLEIPSEDFLNRRWFNRLENFSNRLFAPSVDGTNLILYEYRDGDINKIREWENTHFYSYYYPLNESTYFSVMPRENRIQFVKTNSDHIIVNKNLDEALFPQEERRDRDRPNRFRPFIFVPNNSNRNHHRIIAIPSPIGRDFDIFEIQSDAVMNNGDESLFLPIGKCDYPPAIAMRNNSVLVCFDWFRRRNSDEDSRNERFYYFQRDRNTDGTLGPFQKSAKTVYFSKPPDEICSTPLDDEHLLFYRDQALWSIRWDGREERRLFPSPKIN